jgi:hypothetical protein
MTNVNLNLVNEQERHCPYTDGGSRSLASRFVRLSIRSVCQVMVNRVWLMPLALSMVLSSVLIERKLGLFHAHFLGTAVLHSYSVPLFLLASAVSDLAVIYPLLLAWDAVRRLLRFGERVFVVVGSAIAMGTVVTLNFVNYNVVTYLGDSLNLNAAIQVGSGISGTIPYVLSCLSGRALIVGTTCLGVLGACVAILVVSLLVDAPSRPSLRRKVCIAAGIWACAIAVEFTMTRSPFSAVSASVRRTSLHHAVGRLIAWISDFDRDGSGWIDWPPDFAPFDSRRYPLAVDIPDNGIDEDGIGGDLHKAAVTLEGCSAERPGQAAILPDILLVIPCSLRYDAVFGGALGPGAAPRLASLAKKGIVVDPAYSHAGCTSFSIPQTFCGHLAYQKHTLIEDLKSFGYQVGVYSTQDEQFGNIYRTCGFAAADFYFDAATAATKYGAKTIPSSTIVPSQWIIDAFEQSLRRANEKTPLFAYLHLETTHYPYSHDCQLNIVPHKNISGVGATPGNRADLVEVYRNAVANLDVQISRIVSLFCDMRRRGPPVIVVFADHGESLFDDGMLGHGIAINEVQTRVPCIIVNGWGNVAVPFGHADLRPYILNLLATSPPNERVPKLIPAVRPLLQHSGSLTRPSQIAEVSATGRIVVDFLRHSFVGEDGAVSSLSDACSSDPRCLRLIHRWEALRYLRHVEEQTGDDPTSLHPETGVRVADRERAP